VISTRGCTHKFKQLPDLGEVADYSFTDVNGKTRTSKDFKDKIVLLTTLQVTCPNNCAISLVNLNLQVYQLAKNFDDDGIKIISYVTDENGVPVDDLTFVQKMLKDRIQDYDPNLWILAAGNPTDVYDLEHEGRKLLDETGDEFYAGKAYLEMMLLIDKSNHLRMILSGNSEGMIRKMKQHVALLQKQYDTESRDKNRTK
ncbi:MAG: SCO family protein, partial [Crocinitomicaceae bacterium]|nr:SCO family protein [Crocinitomicaceae bacterium]